MAKLDENGHEVLDDTPANVPVRFRHVDSLVDTVKRVIREQASLEAQNMGMETFEEADDFDCDDDYNPTSPHEMSLDTELYGGPTTLDQARAEAEKTISDPGDQRRSDGDERETERGDRESKKDIRGRGKGPEGRTKGTAGGKSSSGDDNEER